VYVGASVWCGVCVCVICVLCVSVHFGLCIFVEHFSRFFVCVCGLFVYGVFLVCGVFVFGVGLFCVLFVRGVFPYIYCCVCFCVVSICGRCLCMCVVFV